jgi:hypothetical protein
MASASTIADYVVAYRRDLCTAEEFIHNIGGPRALFTLSPLDADVLEKVCRSDHAHVVIASDAALPVLQEGLESRVPAVACTTLGVVQRVLCASKEGVAHLASPAAADPLYAPCVRLLAHVDTSVSEAAGSLLLASTKFSDGAARFFGDDVQGMLSFSNAHALAGADDEHNDDGDGDVDEATLRLRVLSLLAEVGVATPSLFERFANAPQLQTALDTLLGTADKDDDNVNDDDDDEENKGKGKGNGNGKSGSIDLLATLSVLQILARVGESPQGLQFLVASRTLHRLLALPQLKSIGGGDEDPFASLLVDGVLRLCAQVCGRAVVCVVLIFSSTFVCIPSQACCDRQCAQVCGRAVCVLLSLLFFVCGRAVCVFLSMLLVFKCILSHLH